MTEHKTALTYDEACKEIKAICELGKLGWVVVLYDDSTLVWPGTKRYTEVFGTPPPNPNKEGWEPLMASYVGGITAQIIHTTRALQTYLCHFWSVVKRTPTIEAPSEEYMKIQLNEYLVGLMEIIDGKLNMRTINKVRQVINVVTGDFYSTSHK